jgi:hypothetical protein
MRRTCLGIAAFALAVAGLLAGVGVGPASALTSSGPLIFQTSDHTSTLRSGNATTHFAVAVPAHSTCPVDSTKGTIVVSFVVPAGTDPATIGYREEYVPTRGYWLADAAGGVMLPVLTGRGTGLIPSFDQVFVWQGLLTGGNVPVSGRGGLIDPSTPQPGVWTVGVACSLLGRVQRYWSTDVAFAAASGSTFTWHLVGVTPSSGSGGSSHAIVIALVVVAAIAVAVGLVVVLRRRRVAEPPPEGASGAGAGPDRSRPKVPSR